MPASIRRLDIPAATFAHTLRRLGAAGTAELENIAYWSGMLDGSKGRVVSAIFAEDFDGFSCSAGHASMTHEAGLCVAEEVHRRGEVMFAQVHTHPRGAFHSRVDDNHPISHRRGFFSVVVPHFGVGVESVSQCRVYEYRGAGRWKALRSRTASSRFRVIEEMAAR